MKYIVLFLLSVFYTASVFSQQHPNTIETKKTILGPSFKQRNVNLLPRDLLEVTKEYPEIHADMLQAKKTYNTAMGLALGGGAVVAYPVSLYLGGGNPKWIFAAVGGAVVLTSIPFAVKYNKQVTGVVNRYNEALPPVKRSGQLNMKLDLGANGFGVKMQF